MKTLLCFFSFLIFTSCGIFQNQSLLNKSPKAPSIQTSDNTIITKQYVETGGLYDRNFEIQISGTGKVRFKGKFGGKEFYKEEWNIPKENVARLVENLNDSGFFQLGDSYGKDTIDVSLTTISINIDGKGKSVKRLSSNNTPEEIKLREFDHLINNTVNAEPRIRECCYFPSYYPSESIP